MKICLVCSHGGHLTQTLQLVDALQGHQFFFVTYHGPREADIAMLAPAYYTDFIGTNIWRMFLAIFWDLKILLRERPEVILSLGSEIAIPFFYLAKVLRIKTIFIETWSRIEDRSFTARVVYPVADVFLVQWPQLLKLYGRRARYAGAVV